MVMTFTGIISAINFSNKGAYSFNQYIQLVILKFSCLLLPILGCLCHPLITAYHISLLHTATDLTSALYHFKHCTK